MQGFSLELFSAFQSHRSPIPPPPDICGHTSMDQEWVKWVFPAHFAQEKSNLSPSDSLIPLAQGQPADEEPALWQGWRGSSIWRGVSVAGHPFCRPASGCEQAKTEIFLFSTSTGLWTLWWVSSAINTSLKGRCLLDRGPRNLERSLGGRGWISQAVYAKPSQRVTSQSMKSYHQCRKSFCPRPCPQKDRQWLQKWKRELTPVIRRQDDTSKNSIKFEAPFT